MSADPQKELLKLYAYATLTDLWIKLGTMDSIDEDDAASLLSLQNAMIKVFDKTLQTQLDETSMQTFREYVDKYRVRISREHK
jgi:hypothetical protein